MLAQTRRNRILDLLREEGAVRVSVLSEIFRVSEVTVRQDLEKLAAQGLVVREHGGAHLANLPGLVGSLQLERTENMDKKAAIGRLAASLIKDGDSIILDAGSTTTQIANALVGRNELTVITNAVNIALVLGSQSGIHTIVSGGEFKAPTLSLTGETAGAFFANVHVSKAFLAAAGVSPRAGLTYPGFADLPVKRGMIEAAERVYLVADSSKIGKTGLATLGPLNLAQVLITDWGITPEARRTLEERGVEVLVAHEGEVTV